MACLLKFSFIIRNFTAFPHKNFLLTFENVADNILLKSKGKLNFKLYKHNIEVSQGSKASKPLLFRKGFKAI